MIFISSAHYSLGDARAPHVGLQSLINAPSTLGFSMESC
jgi:hypothetical protein